VSGWLPRDPKTVRTLDEAVADFEKGFFVVVSGLPSLAIHAALRSIID
jgi:KaiC/GvpD/RAD55 family RecA-like ATPase